MFGYVKTDYPNMFVKDTVLYKAAYCGLCKSIGKTCGTSGRFLLNYDLTFFSVLLHNLSDADMKIERKRCIIHPIVKRPVASNDALTDRIAALNVILARYKLNDNIIDSGRGRLKRAFFARAYKRAKKAEPKLDQTVKTRYEELLRLERADCDSIDMSADPFGNMMADVSAELLGSFSDDNTRNLFYALGKWIYLIDAIDDFDKDLKKKSFNVFVNAYKDSKTKEEFLEKHAKDVIIVFGTVIGSIAEAAGKLNYKFNHDLTDNVLLRGIREQTKKIMENKKCKNTTKS